MIGGLLKRGSVLAIAASASIFSTNAMAADLGGDCCADLEERVAELEATTARKGNRKVSLTVSGWVNEEVLFWDDGIETNTYQETNMVAQTRFRMVGSAKINEDWSAGYIIEVGVIGAHSGQLNADRDDGTTSNALNLRHSAWYLKSKRLGKITVGQFSQATDGLLDAHIANIGHFMGENGPAMVGNFNLRTATGGNGPTLQQFMGGGGNSGQIGEGTRYNVVRYDSPSMSGFTLSASWGEDDIWDVALRYAGEFNGIKIAMNVGYEQWRDGNPGTPANTDRSCVFYTATDRDQNCSQFGIFGGLLHAPTGLFIEAGYGIRWDDNVAAGGDDTSEQWWVTAGIERKFFPLGKTTIFGGYQEWNVGTIYPYASGTAGIISSDLTAWSIGINQQIEAAAMDLYLLYRNYDGDTFNGRTETEYENFHQLQMGGIIRF